jgi:RsiW-degrading membrane proteinase PrsW (M82 family)
VFTRITLGISSLAWLALMLGLAISTGAAGFALCLGLAITPVPVVLAAFRWIDRAEPEPTRLLLVAFMWGATTASLLSMLLETVWGAQLWVTAPIVEEILKGSILVLLLLFMRSEFDGVIDGVVYAGWVATGFAFTENIGYFANAYSLGLAAPDGAVATPGQAHVADTIASFALRGVLMPFSHSLFTVMFGIGIGLAAISVKRGVRVIAPVVGLAAAIGLHMLWDGVLMTNPGAGEMLAVLGFFMAEFFAMIVVVSRMRRRELRSIEQHLQSYANQGWLATTELPVLATFKGRRQAQRWAASVGGKQGKLAMIDVQRAATKLGLLHRKLAAGRAVPDFATRQHTLLVQLAGGRMVLALAPMNHAFGMAGQSA